MVATVELPAPIMAEKAKAFSQDQIDAIRPGQNYTAHIQLGARTKWRNYGSGRWQEVEFDPSSKKKEVVHKPNVVETAPITGKVLAGLMVGHNEWVKANKDKERAQGTNSTNHKRGEPLPKEDVAIPVYKGDVALQLLVIDYEETTQMVQGDMSQMEVFAQVIQKAVVAAVEGVLKSQEPAKQQRKS